MTAAVFTTTPVVVVDRWTGKDAATLRAALRLTNEAFAHRIGTAVRTVAKWNANPRMVPMPELQQVLDTVLSQAPIEAKHRFVLLAAPADGYTDGWSRIRG
jgi:DNA-binding transcriptional regulator YiaG